MELMVEIHIIDAETKVPLPFWRKCRMRCLLDWNLLAIFFLVNRTHPVRVTSSTDSQTASRPRQVWAMQAQKRLGARRKEVESDPGVAIES